MCTKKLEAFAGVHGLGRLTQEGCEASNNAERQAMAALYGIDHCNQHKRGRHSPGAFDGQGSCPAAEPGIRVCGSVLPGSPLYPNDVAGPLLMQGPLGVIPRMIQDVDLWCLSRYCDVEVTKQLDMMKTWGLKHPERRLWLPVTVA